MSTERSNRYYEAIVENDTPHDELWEMKEMLMGIMRRIGEKRLENPLGRPTGKELGIYVNWALADDSLQRAFVSLEVIEEETR